MKITTGIELAPWKVPNFALVQIKPKANQIRSEHDAPAIPIADLDQAPLDALAEQWLNDLYEKAGKERPPSVVLPTPPQENDMRERIIEAMARAACEERGLNPDQPLWLVDQYRERWEYNIEECSKSLDAALKVMMGPSATQ